MSTDESPLPSVGDTRSKWENMNNLVNIGQVNSPGLAKTVRQPSASGHWHGAAVPQNAAAEDGRKPVGEKKQKPMIAPKPMRLSASFISTGGRSIGGSVTNGSTHSTTSPPSTLSVSSSGTRPAPPPPRSPLPPRSRSITPTSTRTSTRTPAPPPPPPPRRTTPVPTESAPCTPRSPSKLSPQAPQSELDAQPKLPPRPTMPEEAKHPGRVSSLPLATRPTLIQTASGPSVLPADEAVPPPPLPGRITVQPVSSSNPHLPLPPDFNKNGGFGLLQPPCLPPRPSRSLSPADRIRYAPLETMTTSLGTTLSSSSIPDPHEHHNNSSSGVSTPAISSTSELELSESDEEPVSAVPASIAGHPDSSQVNRRAPIFEGLLHEIPSKSEVKCVEVYGNIALIASAGFTKILDLQTGTPLWSMSHSDTKVTAAGFLPNNKIWLGTKEGQLWEVLLDQGQAGAVGAKRSNVHMTALVAIRSFPNCTWTLSEDGKICIWNSTDLTCVPKTYRVVTAFKASCIAANLLWVGKNRQVFVYKPSMALDTSFLLTPRPVAAPTSVKAMVGEFTCSASLSSFTDYVYFGHEDGTISIFSQTKLAAVENVAVSINKVTALCGVGRLLWIGLKTGNILVCDVTQRPWKAMKEWKAHDGPVLNITCHEEALAIHKNALPVASYSLDNTVRLWDGLLKHDWIGASILSLFILYN